MLPAGRPTTRPMPTHDRALTVADREVPLGTLVPGRPVLAATDGSGCADGAMSFALGLARARGTSVRLISVVEPTLNVQATRARREQIEAERRERRLAEVRAQLSRLAEPYPLDDVVVLEGEAVATIAGAAADGEASLLALGLHSHGIVDRVFRDETALRVARRVRCPLLAVTPTQRGLPHDAVAAVDFSPSSIAAARKTATLLADGGRLRLVHVLPEGAKTPPRHGSERLDALAADLAAEHDLEIACVVRRGTAHTELEAELRADPTELVALGCRRCTPSDSAGPGRLTAAYVRAAEVSLVVGTPSTSVIARG